MGALKSGKVGLFAFGINSIGYKKLTKLKVFSIILFLFIKEILN
jgi:hypothetical protein